MIDSKAVVFECQGAILHGILDEPAVSGKRAVLIVVGGPQFRVGSHRQFTLLSRYLAISGFPVLRFDHRGIGDSDGETSFEYLGPDIASAVNKLCIEVPEVSEIVLWGLCDAASASMMYASSDPRIKGLILLNPWVRDDKSLAKAYMKHYYVAQFFSRDFWYRIMAGKVNIVRSLKSLVLNMLAATKPARNPLPPIIDNHAHVTFIDRMKQGLGNFKGRVLFLISGEDLTAAEFCQLVDSDRSWKKIIRGDRIDWQELPEADHTFSRKVWREQVERKSRDWISSW